MQAGGISYLPEEFIIHNEKWAHKKKRGLLCEQINPFQ
jgi:hypothetical protein